MRERLRAVPLFAELADDDLDRLGADAEEVTLPAGATLFSEGEEGDAAYLVLDGQVAVVTTTGGQELTLAVRGVDEVVGEGALLRAAPRTATVRAVTPVTLLRIPRSGIEALLAAGPAAARALIGTLVDRTAETGDRLRRVERLAQLGTLTAGVAHELNNPAAAIGRAAAQMGVTLGSLAAAVGDLDGADGVPAAVRALRSSPTDPLSDPIERSDREEDVASWLERHGMTEPWRWSGGIVAAGWSVPQLEAALAGVEAAAIDRVVRLAVLVADAERSAARIGEAADRLSGIVGALRSHSHLDRARVADVDVRRGLADTVTLLAHPLRGIDVVVDHDPDLPPISGDGGSLNQVWTNLLANAADALRGAEVADPHIWIRTRAVADQVVVEIEDDGPGIPPDVQARIFDAFFTTKPPGAGTGLGLHLSREIVVRDHGGTIEVDSVPGRTTFRVALPRTFDDARPPRPTRGEGAA